MRCMKHWMRAERLLKRRSLIAGLAAFAKIRKLHLRLKKLASVFGHCRLSRGLRALVGSTKERQTRRQLCKLGSKQWRKVRLLEGLAGLYAFAHNEPRPQLKRLRARLEHQVDQSDIASKRAVDLYQLFSHRGLKPSLVQQ